jgi:hypothetical protein
MSSAPLMAASMPALESVQNTDASDYNNFPDLDSLDEEMEKLEYDVNNVQTYLDSRNSSFNVQGGGDEWLGLLDITVAPDVEHPA